MTILKSGKLITKSAEETIGLGKKIGAFLLPNDIIALHGQLGAGKTTLIQGIAQGLGIKDYVTSPSFVIINEYQGRIPLYHADLYRLESLENVKDLGIEEYFDKGGVLVVEWAEKMDKLLPNKYHEIKIEVLGENKRKICLSSELAAQLK